MTLSERLTDKAKEAFSMAIELYNKPTIRYRLEGFSMFICNAWELLLKAHMIDKFGEESVYYPDSPNRTLSLENCIQKVFTNETAPLRRNLEKIVDLRNTSTHFITEEYESLYTPLLQACVFNFVDKMMEFRGVDMTEIIPENFITLSVRINALDESSIRGKYTEQIAERLINVKNTLDPMIRENNSNFAIRIEHLYYSTKDRNEATELYHIAKDAEEGARIIRELKDPNQTHKYNAKSFIREIRKKLDKNSIVLLYKGNPTEFNKAHFTSIVKYFQIKENPRFCYVYRGSSTPQYTYSQQAIDFVFDELKKSPETILDDMREKTKK